MLLQDASSNGTPLSKAMLDAIPTANGYAVPNGHAKPNGHVAPSPPGSLLRQFLDDQRQLCAFVCARTTALLAGR